MKPFDARRYRLTGPLGTRFAGGWANRLFANAQHYVTFNPGESVEEAVEVLEPPVWQPGTGGKVLTVYARFPYPWKSEAEEVDVYNAGAWHPSDRDFHALAKFFEFHNHRIEKIASLGDLLNTMIAYPEGSIGRLNLISHGNGATIALAGKVIHDDVELGLDEEPPDDTTILDATELSKLGACNSVDCAKPDTPFRRGSGKRAKDFTFRDALKRFAPQSAFMYIYACKGGSVHTDLIQDLADTFQVRVWAFKQELWFFPEIDEERKRVKDRTWCQYPRLSGERVKGLQNLKPDNFAKPAP